MIIEILKWIGIIIGGIVGLGMLTGLGIFMYCFYIITKYGDMFE
jgi:hypothetical protein